MLEVLRSNVNTWECDQMGHLNVRHYFGRANEGLAVLLCALGLPPSRMRERGLALRARDQHIRFSRELRPGALFTLQAGVLAEQAHALRTLQTLQTSDDARSATITSEVGLISLASGEPAPFPEAVLEAARRQRCELPDFAAPRGVSAAPQRVRPSRDELIARGLVGAYLGPVAVEDCDSCGLMRESACMARIADGIGHFFRALQEGGRPSGIGGAAVEYRFAFHAFPRVSDLIEVRSGLKGVGNKTMHMCHYICELESGRCIAASEAVAVWFDLTARKAVAIPDDVRARLSAHVRADLAI